MSIAEFFRSWWLEILLASSCLALVFQLFPGLWWGLLAAVDVRYWSWTVIIILNVIVIFILVGLRAWQNR